MVRVHSGLPFFNPAKFSTCDFLPLFPRYPVRAGTPFGATVSLTRQLSVLYCWCVFGRGAPYENNSHHRRMLVSTCKRFGATGQAKDVRSAVRKGRSRSIRVGMESPRFRSI